MKNVKAIPRIILWSASFFVFVIAWAPNAHAVTTDILWTGTCFDCGEFGVLSPPTQASALITVAGSADEIQGGSFSDLDVLGISYSSNLFELTSSSIQFSFLQLTGPLPTNGNSYITGSAEFSKFAGEPVTGGGFLPGVFEFGSASDDGGWGLCADPFSCEPQLVDFGDSAFFELANPVSPAGPPSTQTLAIFAEAAYAKPGSVIPVGYSEITEVKNVTAGFSGRAFINTAGNQIVLAIAGTDDVVDLIGPNPTFISPTGTPTNEFRDYVGFAAGMLQFLQSHSNYQNAEITITGHSLGGAIGQIIGDASGLRTASFNAPGAKQTIDDPNLVDILNGLEIQPIPGTITNYRTYGDLVSTAGQQFGDSIIYEPPVSRLIVDTFPIGTAKAMHELGILFERIFSEAPTTSDVGPTLLTVGSSVLLAGLLGPGILDITNLVVLAGDGVFFDPGGVDGYLFSIDPGSPNIQSIRFPFLFYDDALFKLETILGDTWLTVGLFEELELYDFGPGGVNLFRFFALHEETLSPLANPEPFTFELTFAADGTVNGRLVSFSTVSEPATLALFAFGLAGLGFMRRRKLDG